ncbi:TIGR03016 family PEP-CTERM system-associated outer membrane protein [Alteromonas sp. 1_MG-2023]|uniref:TIGR03016 family PEP-CTERM system-associated outer membrane protein n=1 Tax=Alteromonas sp. 1_MG-2023 TaxID=3062669 RepID=UPI0026E439DB|nr:TIGR03016 family PEP-CTERM system-associated outer membrane protein [Alteromonas sp. 1_MG-2023]MDO6566344.1 TIGR03016 family PEP-CTERM system-associated outer membrane protein [Alteromonas sp. 1_MG-2023]
MVITTLSAKTKAPDVGFKYFNRKAYLAVAIAAISPSTYANVDITGSAQAESVFQNIDTEENGKLSLSTFTITPKVNAIYQSRTFNGLWSGTLTHLERDNDDIGQTQNYAEYSYSAQWAPLNEVLTFQATGALDYRNADSSSFLVSDFLTNSDSLAKTRNNTLSSTLLIDKNNWVNAQGSASYSDVASESSTTSSTSLNNDSYQLFGTLTNGEYSRYVIWEATGSYQNTESNQSSSNDFITRTADAFTDFRVLEHWAIRLTASHEANQVSNRTDTNSLTREYNSFGVGLTYRQSENRYIAITANKSDSDVDEDDDETFVGLDMLWALSARTQIGGSYGRRFYGESASANIKYNSKYFRSSLTYSEDVTNTSRLLSDTENLGVFVCPVTSSSISSCFQPSSLTYTPSVDEQFVQLSSQNLDFDDSIILQKRTNFQMGYSFSRINLGMSWIYSENDYLDEDRLQRTLSLTTTLSYKLGSYTNLNTSLSFAKIDGQSEDNTYDGTSDNLNATLGLDRSFGQHLEASLDLSYIDKSGDLASGGGLYGNDYTDRRITLSVTYTYQ